MLMIQIAGTMASVREIIRRIHGRMRQRMKPSITTCPASVPVIVLLWPLASSATAKSVLASGRPQQRGQRQVRDADPVAVGAERDHLAARHGHALLAVEHHRRQHEDRRVDEERNGQRHGGVNGVEADGACGWKARRAAACATAPGPSAR